MYAMMIDNSYGMTLDDTDFLYEKNMKIYLPFWVDKGLTAGFQLSLWFAPYPQS